MAVSFAVSRSKRNPNLHMSQMNGDFLTHLRRPKRSEASREIMGANSSSKTILKKQVDEWYREQNAAINKIKREQEKVYKILLNSHKEKKSLYREALFRKLRRNGEEEREGFECKRKVNVMVVEKGKSVKLNNKTKSKPLHEDDLDDLAAKFISQGKVPSMGDEKVEKWLEDHIAKKKKEELFTDKSVLPPIAVMQEHTSKVGLKKTNNLCNNDKVAELNESKVEKEESKLLEGTGRMNKHKSRNDSGHKEQEQKERESIQHIKAKAMKVIHSDPKTISKSEVKLLRVSDGIYISSGNDDHFKQSSVNITSRKTREIKTNVLPAINEIDDEKKSPEHDDRNIETGSQVPSYRSRPKINFQLNYPIYNSQNNKEKKFKILPPIKKSGLAPTESVASTRSIPGERKLSFVAGKPDHHGIRSGCSDDLTEISKDSKKAGTVHKSLIDYNRRKRKQKEEYRKSVLDSEEYSIYQRDHHGNLVASELSFKRSMFLLPTQREHIIQKKMLEATRKATSLQREKMEAFFSKIAQEDYKQRKEWEEKRRKILQEEEARKAAMKIKKQKEPLSRSLNMYMVAFRQDDDLPEGADPNSFEVIRRCRYIRVSSPTSELYQHQNQHKRSSWDTAIAS